MPVFGVPRGLRIPGAQRFEVVQLEPESTQVELDVEGQTCVAARQHETIPPGPLRVGRVVPHDLLEQQVRRGRKAHRRARMAVAGFLDRVGGEHPYGVDGARVELGPAVGGDCDIGHDRAVPSEGANSLTRTPRAYRWATAADMGTVQLRSCTGECQSMMRGLDFPIGAPVEGALDLPADVWGVSGACDE